VSGAVADTSVWIEFLAGKPTPGLESALAQRSVVLPPIVVAELMSGTAKPSERRALEDLLRELPLHDSAVDHWIRVGDLRRRLRERGLSVSTPDAHVAQCAIDRDAVLLARDAIFERLTEHCPLRLDRG
jgi:predicted nucleic acid-binding protein